MNQRRLSDDIYLAWYLLTTSPFSHDPVEALEAIRRRWPEVNQDTTVKVFRHDARYFAAQQEQTPSGIPTESRASWDNTPTGPNEAPVVRVQFVDLEFQAAYIEVVNRLYIRQFEE